MDDARPRPDATAPVLEVSGISKTFGPARVLKDLDMSVLGGEIRGLLGQNGSGKSTFIKVLGAYHDPDPGGRMMVRGQEVTFPLGPEESARLGISVMHQDLGLETSLSILDNFLLRPGVQRALGRLRWRQEEARVRDLLADFGFNLNVRRPLGELSGAQRTGVALARTVDRLGHAAGLLVLDEPTASLERGSIEVLFRAVRAAQSRGCGVLYVSHDLSEVRELCDSVTVLRDGAVVAEGMTENFSELNLIRAIVGKDIGELYPSHPTSPPQREAPVLVATKLTGGMLRDVSLELRAGQITGVTGLAAMGQDDLPELLFGSLPIRSGTVDLFGRPHRPSPRASLSAGMALVVADRKHRAGNQDSSLRDNLTLPIARRYFRRARWRRDLETRDVAAVLQEFDVRPPDPDRPLGQLSGGNQQKALLGKWLSLFGAARILLLHEPTQGVDVGARQEIFQNVRNGASRGLAVLYVSTEYEDLARLCDRVLIVRNGRIKWDLQRGEFDGARLAALAFAEGDVEQATSSALGTL